METQKYKVIALIAARGGSKRVPRKNIKELNGKPLISYIIETALNSQVFAKVIVSTEDLEIAEISKKSGADVPFLRPKELATDSTLMGPVIKHALKWLEDNEKYRPDVVVILQAPTPFVKPHQIKKVVDKLLSSNSDVVYTVNEVDYPPYWMQTLVNNPAGYKPEMLIKDFDLRNKQGSDLPKTYRPNGAVYAARVDILRNWDDNMPLNLPFESINTYVEIIDSTSAIDIDRPFDFMLAEFVIKNGFHLGQEKR